jgi:hydrophobic/amphiphilic exporter-1 (mainly G- bacteria), HAE1 family
MQLLDRLSGELKDLDANASDFVAALNQEPSIAFASNSFSTDFPQLEMEIDIAKAKESGVTVNDILSTLQGYVGGFYASDFSRFGKQFRVFVQALPEDRDNIESLNTMFVKTSSNEMAPLSQFVTLNRVYGPQTVNRFNLYNSVTINGISSSRI